MEKNNEKENNPVIELLKGLIWFLPFMIIMYLLFG